MTGVVPALVRRILLPTMAVALVACMDEPELTECNVEGLQYLAADATQADICATFAHRLSEAFAAAGANLGEKNLSVTLRLHKSGTAEAIVTGAAGAVSYPPIAIDVMDRPLATRDIATLADTVARILLDD